RVLRKGYGGRPEQGSRRRTRHTCRRPERPGQGCGFDGNSQAKLEGSEKETGSPIRAAAGTRRNGHGGTVPTEESKGAVSHSLIQESCQRVMDRIHNSAARSRRDPASIRLIAVTKTVSPERIRAAAESGVREIGENRLQEALSKKIGLEDLALTWHFIGHLQ